MQITCLSCSNRKNFAIPLWVRATFKINGDGTLAILHTRPLESLEEKLTDQGRTSFALTCQNCGGEAEISFNACEQLNTEAREKQALEGL